MRSVLICPTCRETHTEYWHVCPGPPPPTILHPVAGESDFLKRQKAVSAFPAPHVSAWSVGDWHMPAAERAHIIAKGWWKPVMDDVVPSLPPPKDVRAVATVGKVYCAWCEYARKECTACAFNRAQKKPEEAALPGPGECWADGDSRLPSVPGSFRQYPGHRDGCCTNPSGRGHLCCGLIGHAGPHYWRLNSHRHPHAIWRDPLPLYEDPAPAVLPGPQTGAPLLFGREMEGASGDLYRIDVPEFYVVGFEPGDSLDAYTASPWTQIAGAATRTEAEHALLERACEDEAVRKGIIQLGVLFQGTGDAVDAVRWTDAHWTDENGDRQRWEA